MSEDRLIMAAEMLDWAIKWMRRVEPGDEPKLSDALERAWEAWDEAHTASTGGSE